MVFLACSIDLTSLNEICPAVTLGGTQQEMFLHTALAHSSNDTTHFQGVTDCAS